MKRLLLAIGILVVTSPSLRAEPQKNTAPCPPVKAKNAQEATMMEGASDKNGCWSRDAGGNLVFLGSASPSKNYKPLVGGTKGRCPKLPATLPNISAPGSSAPGKPDPIVGKWRVTCCSYLGGTGFGNFTPHAADGTLTD